MSEREEKKKSVRILGISVFYHDSAAALVVDGRIAAAAQEERFTRKKHSHSFPMNTVHYYLKEEGIDASQLDYVVFYEKPLVRFVSLTEVLRQKIEEGAWAYYTYDQHWSPEGHRIAADYLTETVFGAEKAR